MHEHGLHLAELAWPIGWLIALFVLFVASLKLPLQGWFGRLLSPVYAVACVAAAVAAWVLANLALTLHDAHIDLTREKIYTPSEQAMQVADGLTRPVVVTYFYRSQDPAGRRAADLLEVMGRRSPLLTVRTVDPDKQPDAARREGVRLYNAAVIEAEGRRVLVQGVDEAEIAIGIQRVLRERAITVCFIEGHNELPMDAFEFHSHLESVADHSHSDASSKVIETQDHGVGRLRRALEAQGYETQKIVLATRPDVPRACTLAIIANPRTTFLPAESRALRSYLEAGGGLLALFDLGFALEPELARLMADLGAEFEQAVVVDPLSHYQSDPEMVAVTGYDPHPITRTTSLTFYPGARPIAPTAPAPGITPTPLVRSSRDSYTRPVAAAGAREVAPATAEVPRAEAPVPGPRTIGLPVQGRLKPEAPDFRALLMGDADFASNSFLPYMANSDLLVAAVRWLAREERGPMVRTRIPTPPLILLTAGETRTIFVLIVILLPLAVVAAGVLVWLRRR